VRIPALSFSKILKDPLAHFLLAGVLLFVVATALNPPAAQDDVIVVDRAAILNFVQYRSKAFEPNAAAALFDSMDSAAQERIIDDFIREEALFREAKALSLETNDYVIRQRMVQKIEFLAEAAATGKAPSAEEVRAYYDANADMFKSPPSATFSHVFVSGKDKPRAAAAAQAERLLDQLRSEGAKFNDALRYGDRFLFHTNYVDRTLDYIQSQLGDEVAAAVFAADAPVNQWYGPFFSDYGAHLVFVASRMDARLKKSNRP
jgi:hypothetical protein